MDMKPLLNAYRDYLSMRPEPEIADWIGEIDWNAPLRNLAPEVPAAAKHMDIVETKAGSAEARLVENLAAVARSLHWFQSYTAEDFGPHFIENYAHIELIGTLGYLPSDRIAGGLVLYGPGIDYPDHWHVAEEIYIPLTGKGLWSKDREPHEIQPAGRFIFHESNMPHAIRCNDTPLLALWLWRGGDLAQKGDY